MNQEKTNVYFLYSPQNPVLTPTVLDFLHNYSSQFYPKQAIAQLQKYRSFMRSFWSSHPDQNTQALRYEMRHHGLVESDKKRYEIFENFCLDDLFIAVRASTKFERAELAQVIKQIKTQNRNSEVIRARDLAVLIRDEVRTEFEFWNTLKAASELPAIDFFNKLADFLSSGISTKLFVRGYVLTKTPETTRMRVELIIPAVISHSLVIDCAFN